MCYANEKAHTLVPSIIMHTLFNLGVMYFMYERESLIAYVTSFAVLSILVVILRILDPQFFAKENPIGGDQSEPIPPREPS